MNIIKPFSLSFEFFPPKTEEGMTKLLMTAKSLAGFNPDFFSVTFGAGGSTRQGTLEAAALLQRETRAVVAPHLSCIGSTRKEIVDVLNHYKIMGVKRIVALRGDFPSGTFHSGEFRFANELVAFIREMEGNYFHIDVAAYPETHPQAENYVSDVLNLKRKWEAGANGAITQYFFNSDAYFYLLENCKKHGIEMDIVPGIMPIIQFNKLLRFSETCGAEIPRWLVKRLESYGNDAESVKQFGIEVVHQLCERLLAGGAPGLHFYTLNKAEAASAILKNLNLGSDIKTNLVAV